LGFLVWKKNKRKRLKKKCVEKKACFERRYKRKVKFKKK
jgi:hypothetical protein